MPCIILMILLTIGCYQAESSLPSSNNHDSQLENQISVQLKESFSLRVNQVAFIKAENLELKLVEVKKDSRCPATTQCIWNGLVEITIEARKNGRYIDIALIDKGDNNQPAIKVFDNYAVRLIEVTPYPQKKRTINKKDYSAKIVVSRQ
jgi:biopolymer transport protein ExbD